MDNVKNCHTYNIPEGKNGDQEVRRTDNFPAFYDPIAQNNGFQPEMRVPPGLGQDILGRTRIHLTRYITLKIISIRDKYLSNFRCRL
jgi:hypothetical protein